MFHVFQKIGILRGLDIFTMQFSDVDAGKCAAYLAEQPLGGYIATVDDRAESVSTAWASDGAAPLTREQAIERLQWLATAQIGATFPASWIDEKGAWDNAMRQVAAAALDLIPGARPAGALNPDTLKSMVFPDRYEEEWPGAPNELPDSPPATDQRGTPIEEEPSQAMRAAAMAMQAGVPLDDPDPLATARALVQQADYGRTSQAGAMAEWLIDPQGMAERQQQAGVPLEEDATAGTRLGRPPLSPSSLLLPEVKP